MNFVKLLVFGKRSFDIQGENSAIPNFINQVMCLFSIYLSLIILFILSLYYLLTIPIPLLARFI